MNPKDFPYEKFLAVKEEKEKNLLRLFDNNETVVMQFPTHAGHWNEECRYMDRSLESQLSFLSEYIELESDVIISYLQPWHGVGIYASAYGCKYRWNDDAAPDVMYEIHSLDEIKTLKKPDIYDCEEMVWVLDAIKYFKEKTGGMLEIALTDTQSPSDTASLILDSTEFLAASVAEPKRIRGLLNSITDLIIEFSEAQIETAGGVVHPGHIMPSSDELNGISISDDNMSFISPEAYKNISLPYHNRISRHFGGLALHSCGVVAHNADLLKQTYGLKIFDTAIGRSVDPNPNEPSQLRDAFKNTGIILKVRLGENELELLDDIVDKDLKLIVQIVSGETIDHKNRVYDIVKERIAKLL